MASHRITDADLDRWVEDGLITAGQRDDILRDLAAQQPAERGLNVTTLLYYSGGLLVLVAYSVFLGLQWEELNQGGRIIISALSFAFFGGVSQWLLRSGRFQLPGELLQVVAVAVVPLLLFAVIDTSGLWPEDPGYGRVAPIVSPEERRDHEATLTEIEESLDEGVLTQEEQDRLIQERNELLEIVEVPGRGVSGQERREYQTDLAWARMALAAATLLVALAAFGWSRSPFVLAAAVVAFAALVVDVTIVLQAAREDYTWRTPQTLAIAAMGAALVAVGVAVRDRTRRDYSIWLYVMGLIGLTVGLAESAFSSDAPGWAALWMLAALSVLALSIPLQQRLFAVAGLAAVFAYLAKLVFDVFESANAALVLVILGLLILGMGMLYQRFAERLFARPQSG